MNFDAFIGSSYRSQSPIADSEKTMNLYLEASESANAKAPKWLYRTPGMESFASVSFAPFRALFSQRTGSGVNPTVERCFGVIGQSFYEFFEDGTTTLRGTVDYDDNPATICSNGDGGGQLFITAAGVGYCYDLGTDTLTTELASGATMGGFLDGFFLALDAETSTLQISDLFDGTAWDPTQIAQRTAGSDPWVAMYVVNREIWLLGSETSEVWYNAGLSPFPFAPNPGAFLQIGTAATFSGARLSKSLVWLGQNEQGANVVYRSQGWDGIRISNHALEYALSQMETTADARPFTMQDQGHYFYGLTFPTAQQTWVFDDATQTWHERGFWNVPQDTWQAWRPLYHAFAFGQHLMGDVATGTLWRVSLDLNTDADGEALRWMRRAPLPPTPNNFSVSYPGFELTIQPGVGLQVASSALGYEPKVMMRFSRDGFRWSNERTAAIGRVGQYAVRCRWNQLGAARQNAAIEVSGSDPVPYRLIAAAFVPDPIVGTS